MTEIVVAALTSHAPLITGKPDVARPEQRERLHAGFHECGRRLAAARPDLLVMPPDDRMKRRHLDRVQDLRRLADATHRGGSHRAGGPSIIALSAARPRGDLRGTLAAVLSPRPRQGFASPLKPSDHAPHAPGRRSRGRAGHALYCLRSFERPPCACGTSAGIGRAAAGLPGLSPRVDWAFEETDQ